MTARLRTAVAVALTLGSIWMAELAAPVVVQACSCMPTGPDDIGGAGDDPGIIVFVGTVTAIGGRANDAGHVFGDLTIERLFHGTVPGPVVRVMGGGGGDCTIQLAVGQRMITMARYADAVLTPGLCAPYADPGTAEGRAMIAAAERAYGLGAMLDPGPVTGPPVAPTPDASPALPLIFGATVAAAVVLFGLVALLVRRGRPSA